MRLPHSGINKVKVWSAASPSAAATDKEQLEGILEKRRKNICICFLGERAVFTISFNYVFRGAETS